MGDGSKKVIDTELGMKYCMNRKDFYDQVMNMFASDNKSGLIEELFDRKDWEKYRVEVHAIKGTALTIGAVDLSEIAKSIDLAIKHGDPGFVESNHRGFMDEYIKVLNLIGSGNVFE